MPSTRIEASRGHGVLILLAAAQGRNSAAAREFAQALAASGHEVLSLDLRGWGETTCTHPKKAKFEWDEFMAWRAIEMGRPLLGMRVRDLLSTAAQMAGDRKVYLAGIEAGGLVALHAAAVAPSIAGVATWRTLQSYRDVIDQPDYSEPVSSLVWGALTAYDLPELERAIRPRPCVAIDATDAKRQPVSGRSTEPAVAAGEILRAWNLV